MISWGTILYGAGLTWLLTTALIGVLTRQPTTALAGGLAAATGALAWNAILHSAGGHGFFVDARIAVLPASWQDTGSGVFALAAASLALGLGAQRHSAAGATTRLAVAASLTAFAVDVYLY